MPWTGEIYLYVYRNVSREDWPRGQWPGRKRSTLTMSGTLKRANCLDDEGEYGEGNPPASKSFCSKWYHLLLLLPTDIRLILQPLNTDNSSKFPGSFSLDWDCSGTLGNLVLCLFSGQMAIGELYPVSTQPNKSLLWHIHICAYICASRYTCYWFCLFRKPYLI